MKGPSPRGVMISARRRRLWRLQTRLLLSLIGDLIGPQSAVLTPTAGRSQIILLRGGQRKAAGGLITSLKRESYQT